MSQSQAQSAGGKAPRERRRLSSEQPYKKPRSNPPDMPVSTRHSPARAQAQAPPQAQQTPSQEDRLPLGDIVRELALLRQAMESRFSEAGKKTDSLRTEVIGKLEANDQAVAELQLAVTDVTLSVDQNQRAIHEVRAEVERREVELPGKVRAIVEQAISGRPPADRGTGMRPRPFSRPLASDTEAVPSRQDRRAEAYDVARRSLRLWPIPKGGDLSDRVVDFMVNELRLDQQHASSLNFTAKRSGGARPRDRELQSQVVKDEVVVCFETIRERDDVRSFAKNLERKGRGLRLEVPDHLWPSFRALQEVAFALKQKHTNLRRNVLFDDDRRDLKMDFSIDPDTWKTIYPDAARDSLKSRPQRQRRVSLSGAELSDLLGETENPSGADASMNEEY